MKDAIISKLTDIFWELILGFVILGIASMIVGFPVKWLWNELMPVIFHLQEISFWQACGLFYLAGMLIRK